MTVQLAQLNRCRAALAIPLLVSLGFACGPDPGDVTRDDLIDTWEADAFSFSDFGEPVTEFDVVGVGGSATFTFRANGSYQSTVTMGDPKVEAGTWEQVGTHLLNLTKTGATAPALFHASIFKAYGGSVLVLSSEDVRFDFGMGEVPAKLLARFHVK